MFADVVLLAQGSTCGSFPSPLAAVAAQKTRLHHKEKLPVTEHGGYIIESVPLWSVGGRVRGLTYNGLFVIQVA